MDKINELIKRISEDPHDKNYEYIISGLKYLNDMYDSNIVEGVEDVRYINRMLDIFCEIIDIQADTILDLNYELSMVEENSNLYSGASGMTGWVTAPKASVNSNNIPYDPEYIEDLIEKDRKANDYSMPEGGFRDDKQLQEAFTAYCFKNGKSSYTVNDYCSRIKKLWKTYCDDRNEDKIDGEMRISVERIDPANPLVNVFNNITKMEWYVSKKINENKNDRNFANTRAAFNRLWKFAAELGCFR